MLARSISYGLGIVLTFAAPAVAAEASMVPLMTLEKSLKYQSGDVPVGSNLATLHLGASYRFLSAGDAKKVFVEGWGNPPTAAVGVLGMIAGRNASSPVSPSASGHNIRVR